jgi:hypothetical protein
MLKVNLRIVERKDGETWTVVQMSDIKTHDVFRLTEKEGEDPIGIFTATDDAVIMSRSGDKAIWGVHCEALNDE